MSGRDLGALIALTPTRSYRYSSVASAQPEYPTRREHCSVPDSRLIPKPTIFILYGGTGDLAHRLVLPGLYHLAIAGLLPEDWRLVADGRGVMADEDFQESVRESLEEFGPKPNGSTWEGFRSRLCFAGGGFSTTDPGRLPEVLAEQERALGGTPQRIHYMAVPPAGFGPLTEAIGRHGLVERSRVVYEKPFGTSITSFRELDNVVHATFEERQIYRIDHFLGKEATQDVHVVRFANGLFAGSWDANHIESVQIDVPETLDVAGRASFYDSTGAILDMLVTHLFQLVAEVAMEPPHCLEPDCLAEARAKVIGCFRPLGRADVVVGQYEGYQDIDGVAKDSRTETFVAARIWVDNERWNGVPFPSPNWQVLGRELSTNQRGIQGPGTRSGRTARHSQRLDLRAVGRWTDHAVPGRKGARTSAGVRRGHYCSPTREVVPHADPSGLFPPPA